MSKETTQAQKQAQINTMNIKDFKTFRAIKLLFVCLVYIYIFISLNGKAAHLVKTDDALRSKDDT